MNYAVILAGGVGTRFWPFSRELEPKQFMKIIGKGSLLQVTIERIIGVIPAKNIYLVTNKAYFYEVKAQISGLRIPDDNIILEPQGKNTAPAIALCAKLINKVDKSATLVVLSADHYIKDLPKFRSTVRNAIKVAKRGLLVSIGMKPARPATGYGYIKVRSLRPNREGFFEVEKFLEKPQLLEARRYLKERRFYWNSGIFVWKAGAFLMEIKKYLPGLYRSISLINSKDDIERVWSKIKAISVDYGIMEHSHRIAMLPASFYWTDLGSWDALSEIMPKDKKNNILTSNSLSLDSHGVCVFSRSDRLIATLGVKDLIIADTPDALLVCPKDKAQDVRKIVELLKSLKRKEQVVHLTEQRPWGSFTVLRQGRGFKIKVIEVLPGKRLSLQKHKKRAEHWVVVSGTAHVSSGKARKTIHSNQSVYIPKGTLHRLANPSASSLKIVEVQTGQYLEEDDIERFADDFKEGSRRGG